METTRNKDLVKATLKFDNGLGRKGQCQVNSKVLWDSLTEFPQFNITVEKIK